MMTSEGHLGVAAQVAVLPQEGEALHDCKVAVLDPPRHHLWSTRPVADCTATRDLVEQSTR